MKFKINKKAFTIIELIIVIAALGILVLLAMPKLLGYTEEAQLVRIQNDVKVMENKMMTILSETPEAFSSWDANGKDLGAIILRNQLFEKEGLASNVSTEHLSTGRKLTNLNDNSKPDSNYGLGGALYLMTTFSSNTEDDEESLDPSSGYKIVPEELKNEINTKLKGAFYVNSFGKVYYEHDKSMSNVKQEQMLACVAAETLDYEFDGSTGTIVKYNGKLQYIVIPGAFEVDGECVTVRSIGPGAFMNGGYKSITIPQSIKRIGEDSFKGNELVKVEIPHSVEIIGSGAFSDNFIEHAVIKRDSSNITIGTGVFENNGPTGTLTVTPTYQLPTPEDLKVIFDKSTGTIVSGDVGRAGSSTSLGGNPNNGNSGSGSPSEESSDKDDNKSINVDNYDNSSRIISIPDVIVVEGEAHEVKEVGKGAYQGQGIVYVEFPDSLERINDYAFAGNQLIGVQIPKNIEHIGNYAFAFNEIDERKTINYVNIIDEQNYEHKIDKLGNITESGVKVDLLVNQVNLLDHIFVTSNNFEVPEEYNPVYNDNIKGDEEDNSGNAEWSPEEDFEWVEAAENVKNNSHFQEGSYGERGYFKYIGSDEEVVIPHKINGVEITTYHNMFHRYSNSKLKKVVSTNKNITHMTSMFGYTKLTSLDLSEFDTSNVVNMGSMFQQSTNLSSLNVSSFNTENASNMFGMFSGVKLTSLDLSSFDMSNVSTTCCMFQNSHELTDGYAKTQADANILNKSSHKPSKVKFIVKPNEGELEFTDENQFTWTKVDTNGYLGIYQDGPRNERGYFSYSGSREKVVKIPHEIQGVKVTTYYRMFADNESEIEEIISTNSDVTIMNSMFNNYQSSELKLNDFDTSNVTDMYAMFSNSKIDSLDLSSFKTSNVKIMNSMFRHSKITQLNLSSFDTSNVTNMYAMFQRYEAVTLDLSSFDTSKVTNVELMFNGSSLKEVIARTSADRNKLNRSTSKPSGLNIKVK